MFYNQIIQFFYWYNSLNLLTKQSKNGRCWRYVISLTLGRIVSQLPNHYYLDSSLKGAHNANNLDQTNVVLSTASSLRSQQFFAGSRLGDNSRFFLTTTDTQYVLLVNFFLYVHPVELLKLVKLVKVLVHSRSKIKYFAILINWVSSVPVAIAVLYSLRLSVIVTIRVSPIWCPIINIIWRTISMSLTATVHGPDAGQQAVNALTVLMIELH